MVLVTQYYPQLCVVCRGELPSWILQKWEENQLVKQPMFDDSPEEILGNMWQEITSHLSRRWDYDVSQVYQVSGGLEGWWEAVIKGASGAAWL